MTQFTITELSNNKLYNRTKSSSPQISGKNVVWRIANPNENKIVLYDGNKTIEISSTNGSYPRMSEDNIVWYGSDSKGDIEIFFYNGKETIQVTDNDVDEINPQISGDNVVWVTDTTLDMNIYLYNGQDVIHLNEGNLANEFPKISGDNVVWSSRDSNGNRQIFLYNGKETIQLSGNKHHNTYQVFKYLEIT
ncbi:MAG: TolB family protein [Waterburya sp.]